MLSAAHDLNGALMTLQLAVDEIEVNQRELARELQATIERVQRVVEDLRSLGNPLATSRQTVDVNGLLRQLHKNLRRVTGLGNRANLELTDNATHVAERSALLKLAILGLLHSVVSSGPDGSRVTVTTSTLSASERAIVAPHLLEPRDHVLLGVHHASRPNFADCKRVETSAEASGKARLPAYVALLDAVVLAQGPADGPSQIWLAMPSVVAPARDQAPHDR